MSRDGGAANKTEQLLTAASATASHRPIGPAAVLQRPLSTDELPVHTAATSL
jgi:hypothetical protein